MSIAVLTLATLFVQQDTFKVPVYNFDIKGHPPVGFALAAIPKGFTKGKEDGVIVGPNGSVSVSVGKSDQAITYTQRNPEAKPGEVWSTIRLTQWVGWRNQRSDREYYKMTWSKFSLNFELKNKSGKDFKPLRAGIHKIVDTLVLT
ncbi:MAG TPA: hypothetical protein VK171_07910 [Fimbriimonas sp.]|nr:hypothetical protein [Fimbriimonas sp.]